MKKNFVRSSFYILFCLSSFTIPLSGITEKKELKKAYQHVCNKPSDINEHLPVLKELSKQCTSVVEIGVRSIVSTWAILQGLTENSAGYGVYTGIDLYLPEQGSLAKAKRLAEGNGIVFNFIEANDMNIDLEYTDFLFIDSLHTYCHLTYELEKFSSVVGKYIALHDTSAPWGNQDDREYLGDYSEYPSHYDRSKRGLWPAVENFLINHPEWALLERRFNNHGFTILKRVGTFP